MDVTLSEVLWWLVSVPSAVASLWLLKSRLKDWRVSRGNRWDGWRQLAGEQSFFDQAIISGFQTVLSGAVTRQLFIPTAGNGEDRGTLFVRGSFALLALATMGHTWMSVRQRGKIRRQKEEEGEGTTTKTTTVTTTDTTTKGVEPRA